MKVPLTALFALATACAAQDAQVASVEAVAASPGSTLVLYSDGAMLRYSSAAEFDERGEARLKNVPVGTRTTVRVAGGASLIGEHALATGENEKAKALKGVHVVAFTESGRFEGRFIEWEHRGLALATSNGTALITEPVIALEVADAPSTILSGDLTIRGGERGERTVEIQTWINRLKWRVAYTIILDGLEPEWATLQGWLAVDSPIAQPFSVEQIAIVDGRSTKVAEDVWAQYRRRSDNKPDAPQQPRVAISVLDRGLVLRGGGSVRVPLFATSRRTKVKLSRVFDPIGPSKTHEGTTPIARRNYGVGRESDKVPLSLSVQLELPRAELARLPAGDTSLFARTSSGVRPLGVTKGFGRAPSAAADLISDDQAKVKKAKPVSSGLKARPGELRIGVAPGLSGKRWQEDFSFDEDRKRIVEEIRVEITNSSEEDARVVVHEHLYRGLNWSLAYHNGVGDASKAAAQEIRFRVNVPAKGSALVMYRVVYTW